MGGASSAFRPLTGRRLTASMLAGLRIVDVELIDRAELVTGSASGLLHPCSNVWSTRQVWAEDHRPGHFDFVPCLEGLLYCPCMQLVEAYRHEDSSVSVLKKHNSAMI